MSAVDLHVHESPLGADMYQAACAEHQWAGRKWYAMHNATAEGIRHMASEHGANVERWAKVLAYASM